MMNDFHGCLIYLAMISVILFMAGRIWPQKKFSYEKFPFHSFPAERELIYILFPNCQKLRPAVFERDNIFTHFLEMLYRFDTNTNVCTSIHVIGSVASMLGAWDSRHFGTAGWRIVFGVTAFLVSVSTVFLKQHSVVDIFAAIPICVMAYMVSFKKGNA